jgi:hypothetical protein
MASRGDRSAPFTMPRYRRRRDCLRRESSSAGSTSGRARSSSNPGVSSSDGALAHQRKSRRDCADGDRRVVPPKRWSREGGAMAWGGCRWVRRGCLQVAGPTPSRSASISLLAHELEQQAVGELVGVARATQGLGVGADQAAHSLERVVGDGGGVRGIGGQLEGPSPLNSTTLVGSPVIAPSSSATRAARAAPAWRLISANSGSSSSSR